MKTLAYLNGIPAVTAQYKQSCEDFVVIEDLGFSPEGEGEHVFISIRKRDCNTLFVAEQLAKFAKISPRLVSYAGLKDRQAVTEQWFGLHIPGKVTPDFNEFKLEGCEILSVVRHNRKLRIGVLKGNNFSLTLRDVSNQADLDARLELIKQNGVPNYFGEQRFGRDNNNLMRGIAWAKGEIQVKERNKRSFSLSALRSAIFNQIVSARIEKGINRTVLVGDALQFVGRGSWFVVTPEELASSQQRLDQRELNITAPMVGDGNLGTQEDALAFETQCLTDWEFVIPFFKQERVETARRSMLLMPEQLAWQWRDNQTIKIDFWLPAGSYATSVVRELVSM